MEEWCETKLRQFIVFLKDDFHSGSDSRFGRFLSSTVFRVDIVWKGKALLSPLFDGKSWHIFSSHFERVDIDRGKGKQFKGGDVTLCAGRPCIRWWKLKTDFLNISNLSQAPLVTILTSRGKERWVGVMVGKAMAMLWQNRSSWRYTFDLRGILCQNCFASKLIIILGRSGVYWSFGSEGPKILQTLPEAQRIQILTP